VTLTRRTPSEIAALRQLRRALADSSDASSWTAERLGPWPGEAPALVADDDTVLRRAALSYPERAGWDRPSTSAHEPPQDG
jgi:hypothetical protein